MTNTVDNFKWTDELVKEYATYYKVRIAKVGHLPYFVEEQWFKDFKQSKSIPNKQDERIEVGKMSCSEGEPGYGKMKWNLQFKTNKHIHYGKAVELCNLLERYLNGEMDNLAPTESCLNSKEPLSKVYNSMLFKTDDGEELALCMRDSGYEFKYFGHWYEAKEGIVKPRGQQKTYTQSEVDTITKELNEYWEKEYGLDTNPTTPIEDKGNVLFTTDDGVDILKHWGSTKVWLLSTSTWDITDVVVSSPPFKGATGNEFKYFSTKEAAEQYRLENKPCLSLSDLQKEWFMKDEQVQFGKWEGIPMYRRFQNIVKQKLNQ